MTQRDMAGFFNIDVKTLRTWKKTKPNLYKTLMKGLAFDELIKAEESNLNKLKELEEKLQKD